MGLSARRAIKACEYDSRLPEPRDLLDSHGIDRRHLRPPLGSLGRARGTPRPRVAGRKPRDTDFGGSATIGLSSTKLVCRARRPPSRRIAGRDRVFTSPMAMWGVGCEMSSQPRPTCIHCLVEVHVRDVCTADRSGCVEAVPAGLVGLPDPAGRRTTDLLGGTC